MLAKYGFFCHFLKFMLLVFTSCHLNGICFMRLTRFVSTQPFPDLSITSSINLTPFPLKAHPYSSTYPIPILSFLPSLNGCLTRFYVGTVLFIKASIKVDTFLDLVSSSHKTQCAFSIHIRG